MTGNETAKRFMRNLLAIVRWREGRGLASARRRSLCITRTFRLRYRSNGSRGKMFRLEDMHEPVSFCVRARNGHQLPCFRAVAPGGFSSCSFSGTGAARVVAACVGTAPVGAACVGTGLRPVQGGAEPRLHPPPASSRGPSGPRDLACTATSSPARTPTLPPLTNCGSPGLQSGEVDAYNDWALAPGGRRREGDITTKRENS